MARFVARSWCSLSSAAYGSESELARILGVVGCLEVSGQSLRGPAQVTHCFRQQLCGRHPTNLCERQRFPIDCALHGRSWGGEPCRVPQLVSLASKASSEEEPHVVVEPRPVGRWTGKRRGRRSAGSRPYPQPRRRSRL